MNINDMKEFVEIWTLAHEKLCKTISGRACAAIFDDLDHFSFEQIKSALKAHSQQSTFAPHVADIVKILEANKPREPGSMTADEAWAKVPKSESDSALVSQVMMEAWGEVQATYEDGDHTAARMAFRSIYDRKDAERIQAGRPIATWLSGASVTASEAKSIGLGENDKRDSIVDRAREKNRLAASKAVSDGVLSRERLLDSPKHSKKMGPIGGLLLVHDGPAPDGLSEVGKREIAKMKKRLGMQTATELQHKVSRQERIDRKARIKQHKIDQHVAAGNLGPLDVAKFEADYLAWSIKEYGEPLGPEPKPPPKRTPMTHEELNAEYDALLKSSKRATKKETKYTAQY